MAVFSQDTVELVALHAIFLLTSIVSVVSGSTSLTMVPVMIGMGMDPRVAIALSGAPMNQFRRKNK